MIFTTFTRIFEETKNYTDVDMFVNERGWEPWMDTVVDSDRIAKILYLIWDMSRSSFVDLRGKLHLTRVEMASRYRMPTRTLESWENGECIPTDYIKNLFYYSIFVTLLEGDDGSYGPVSRRGGRRCRSTTK